MSREHKCLYCGVFLKRGEGVTIRVIRHDLPREEKVKSPHVRKRAKKAGFQPYYTRTTPTEETARFCTVEDLHLALKAGLIKALLPPAPTPTEMVEGPMGMEERPTPP